MPPKAVKFIFNTAKKSRFLRAVVLFPFYILRFTYFAFKERSVPFYRNYPGYHGSTIPSLKYVSKNKDNIFKNEKNPYDGIDLNREPQVSLLTAFAGYYRDFKPNKTESNEQLYYHQNEMFGFNDGFVLYCFLRHFKPSRIIEVGSGYSSGLMIDVCEKYLPNTDLTFIDPYSTTISDILSKKTGKNQKLIRQEVQRVDVGQFKTLEKNDILFIDTSHVVKIGSDLSWLLFSVLPALNAGVLVHIHDIWYPWEYPEDMIKEGRSYNEIYFVRAFLQYNKTFEIVFFTSFLEENYKEMIEESMPGYFKSTGKSLWLKKIA